MKIYVALFQLLLFLSAPIMGQQVKPNLPWIDISAQKERQHIISSGKVDLYNGHPTTVMLNDNKTIICVWSDGHGGRAAYMAKSVNGGNSWKRSTVNPDWQEMRNCPSIYKLEDKNGKERLFVFCGEPEMAQTCSEDGGESWSQVISLHKPCVMAFASIIKLKNGDYLGMYHRGYNDQDRPPLTLWQSISHDGGLTWEESVNSASIEGRSPCEPCMFRSPDGNRIVCVVRDNSRKGNSLMMFSDDEGTTWSDLKDTPWGITGDRHIIKYAPDGRLVAVFRDMAENSPTKGHFVAWIGNYKDILESTSGQYKIKLLHSNAGSDCGYPGLEILPDGTIIAITYIKIKPGKEQHSIVQTRFKLSQTDSML
ncbi:MAG: sialidase family protein [Bacteroidales bacterium]